MKIKIKDIQLGSRQRQACGDSDSLQQSIQKYGLIEPIIVNQHYELISGYRRVLAHMLLKLDTIDAIQVNTESEYHRKRLELESNTTAKLLTRREKIDALADINV